MERRFTWRSRSCGIDPRRQRSTAAWIWAAAAVGVLLGVGFYAAALLMALLCMLSMSMLQRLEARLPGSATLELCLTFRAEGPPPFEELAAQAESRGYRVQRESLRISFTDSLPMWRFWVVALDRRRRICSSHLEAYDDLVGEATVEPREHAMAADRTVATGTASWQPNFIDQHSAELSRYLDQASRSDGMRRVADCALDLMSPMAGRSVLEVGCGNGVLLARLAEGVGINGRVVAIDHSETFVAEAQAKVIDAGCAAIVTVQQADAYDLPFADATFDLAHCERVLMHLEDPSAALAEMMRAVRPGGWIVAAEPDWGGIRIDHVDRTGMDVLYPHALRSRQPDMGITLYRRMGELGLTERRTAPVLIVNTDYEVIKGHGLTLSPAADALVAEGTLTRSRADTLLSALEDANAAGRFYAAAVMHIVAGRVPG